MPSYTPDEALIQEDSQSSSPSSNSVKGIAAGKKGKKNKARKTKVDTEVREHTEEPSPEPPEITPPSPQLLKEQPSPFANYHSFDPPSDPGSTGNDTLLPPLSPQTKPRDPDPETIESFPDAVPVPARATPQNYGANITPNYSSPASYGSYRHASAYASPSQGAPQRFPQSASPLEGDFRRIQNHMGPPQGRDRSSSMTSKSSHPPRFYEPPPPHMPQRHFSRVSDLSFGLLKDAEDTASPGSNGYFCGFDSLDTANAAVPATANNIILAGSSGCVDIYKMLRQRVEIAGRLEGLHGNVLDAKVLPWTDRHDPYEALRPLVVLVVHGPLQNRGLDCADGLRGADSPSNVTEFQTTVQVFSLKTSKHVSTLYTSAPVTVEHPIGHPLFSGPPVSLSRLQVSAEGKYIAVASGETGEVFIFTPSTTADFTSDPSFLCVGKFWTSVKERLNRPGSSSETRDDQKDGTQGHSSKPIYSLSSRWLAIVPPPVPRRRFSTNGTVSQPDHNLVAPGTSSLMSPAPPVPNCATDLPKSDRLIDWMTKQAAQDFRKGANWIGGYVQQSWNNYRSGPSAPQVTDGQYANRKISAGDAQSAFPPTHAHINEPDPTANEPSLVSVLDLQKLLEYAEGRVKNPLAPLATFQLPDGCSFLSFAPNGLSLLTTNHTGDLSIVWNLMRMNDSKAAHVAASDSSLEQCVGMIQTIARFPRISPSVVVDVAWTDENDRLAILTDKGTVHLHELPTTEFRLEAPHSPAVRPTSRAEYSSPGTSPQPEVPTNGWMSNVRAGINGLHSQFAAARSRSGTNGFALPTLSTLGTASAAARHAGGRVVRNGIHRGFDMAAEGAHHIRHAEDNKIRLRPSSQEVARGCIRWLTGKDRGLLATFADGKVCVYSTKSVTYPQGKRSVTALAASRKPVTDFRLQPVCSAAVPPAVLGLLNPEGPHASCYKEGSHGFWTLVRSENIRKPSANGIKTLSSAAVQDKETSPPTMPFHRSPQVSLFVFNQCSSSTVGEDLGMKQAPWVFGLPLPQATRINCQQSEEDEEFTHGIADGDFEGIMGKMDELATNDKRNGEQAPYTGAVNGRAGGKDLVKL